MELLLTALMIVLGLQVAWSDLYARRVSNRLLATAFGIAAVLHVYGWMFGEKDFPTPALMGLVIGLLSLLPFYALGWMGAGDCKYFAVIGFVLGWKALLPAWCIASLLAGAHAFYILALRHSVAIQPWQMILESRLQQQAWWQRISSARQGRNGIPYAAYLSAGAIATCLMPGGIR